MTRCKKCNVEVECQHTHCPLCGRPLPERKEAQLSMTSYPVYAGKRRGADGFTVKRALLFLSISAVILSVMVNWFTYPIKPVLWSPIVTTAILFAWGLIGHTWLSDANLGQKILILDLNLCLLVLMIDWCTGFSRWSVNYAVPFIGIGATFFLTAIAVWKRTLWKDAIGYVFAMLLINLIPMALLTSRLATVLWTGTGAIAYSLITVIGMIIFAKKTFRREVIRRFHR